MKLYAYAFNAFQENTYLLAHSSGECIIIDPGNSTEEENQALLSTIEREKLLPVAVLNTHCHIDHILGNRYCMDTFNIPLYAHSAEQINIDRAPAASLMWDVPYTETPAITHLLDQVTQLSVAGFDMEVLFVPGHAPGHVAFYLPNQACVFSGDVLFKGSIGRTDLPGCNHDDLLKSISEKMYSLPDHTTVFSGHGPQTTIGEEKQTNPFVRG